MDDDVTIVHHHPAAIWLAFDPAFSFVLPGCFFDHPISQCIQHAVAGGGTYYKVRCEGGNLFNIQQDNIFAFFFFQGIDYSVCKFQCIQMSPLCDFFHFPFSAVEVS
jgi:hypothetical protein